MSNYGFLSLIPVILAVFMAIYFKNVILALFSSVLVGALILSNGAPVTALTSLIENFFFEQLQDSYNAGVLVLLVFIGGFIALMEESGGALAFANRVSKHIDNRKKVQIAAWFGGILIFFSDLGTPLIVGPIFKPLFDKMKVSREKLAYILDSTASPVAVLVPFIGWGVYAMGLIQVEYEALSIMESDWDAFISSIPFNIYSIISVIMVPIIALTGREFSQMAKAEERVRTSGEIYFEGSMPLAELEKSEIKASKSSLIWIPLLVLLVALFVILGPLGFPFEAVSGTKFRGGLSSAYLLAAISLIILMVANKVKTFEESFKIYLKGVDRMMYVALTLVLAWSLSSISKELGTSDYIIKLAQGAVPYWALASITFLICSILSFATGSSWGTYAIMMPIVIPMALALNAPMHPCIGAILAGGMFGDHCSPISDTTILSSSGAGTDHVDHIKTQLPYALLNGFSSFIGFLIAGFTNSPIALLVAIIISILSLLFLSKLRGVKIEDIELSTDE